jgi:hypothetical protein
MVGAYISFLHGFLGSSILLFTMGCRLSAASGSWLYLSLIWISHTMVFHDNSMSASYYTDKGWATWIFISSGISTGMIWMVYIFQDFFLYTKRIYIDTIQGIGSGLEDSYKKSRANREQTRLHILI